MRCHDSKNDVNICLTFDVDFTNFISANKMVDECSYSLPDLLNFFKENLQIKATWFIRLDEHMEKHFEHPDYIFIKYKSLIEQFQRLGHEIGWHPHCYEYSNGEWKQNTDSSKIINELSKYVPLVKELGISSIRLGWGYQTNEIIHFLSNSGFKIDSSAIPRPNYPWDTSVRNWDGTSLTPYFPSRLDYRISGEDSLDILEIPISVGDISAPYDEISLVIRYFNPAFKGEYFIPAFKKWVNKHNFIITITHPYELIPNEKHPLISFDIDEFKNNINAMIEIASDLGKTSRFVTLNDFSQMAKTIVVI